MENLKLEDSNELTSGLLINELLQVKPSGELKQSNYYSRIADIVEEKLVVAWPTSEGIRLPVHPDQILEFSLVRDGNAYSFSGLIDSTESEPLPLVTIIVTSHIQRIQRRQDFRIKCMVPVEIFGALPGASEDTHSTLHLATSAYDLSASGVSIRDAKSLPEGAVLEVRIGMPDEKGAIKVPCKMEHCSVLATNARLYHVGMSFLAINEKDKARIVRYIYRAQLAGLRV